MNVNPKTIIAVIIGIVVIIAATTFFKPKEETYEIPNETYEEEYTEEDLGDWDDTWNEQEELNEDENEGWYEEYEEPEE